MRRQRGARGEEGRRMGNGNLGPNFSSTTCAPMALGKACCFPCLDDLFCEVIGE